MCKILLPLGAPSIMSLVIRSLLKVLPESGVLKKEKKGMRASWRLNHTLVALSSRLHLCPWYFERVIVHAWYEHRLNGAGVEAGLLIELLAWLTILLRGTPDSLDGVRRCRCRIGCFVGGGCFVLLPRGPQYVLPYGASGM